MDTQPKIPRRIAQTLLNSLKGGVVPRTGLPYITVGRRQEIDALLHDVDIVAEGGAAFRFITGQYGSGKSFLLQTIRNYVMDRGFVVVDADLSPERRLHGNHNQGLATYRELMRNMSVKSKPDGGALSLTLDRWISSIQTQTAATTGLEISSPEFASKVEQQIMTVVQAVKDMVHGFDFAKVLVLYYRAYLLDQEETKANVIRWFRGEYTTKTDARRELGVNIIVTDDNWYEFLRLMAGFYHQAGYKGLIVLIDELVNIYKIPNAIARQSNYEKILTMYNDALQGKVQYMGTLMCGTPQCLEDTRRGVYSYEALRSRLQEGKFSTADTRDLLAPVIRLAPLSPTEMLVLTEKLTAMHADLYGYSATLDTPQLEQFIQIEYNRIGASQHITPREVIRDFIELLDILYQHPETDMGTLLQENNFQFAQPTLDTQEELQPDFAQFTL